MRIKGALRSSQAYTSCYSRTETETQTSRFLDCQDSSPSVMSVGHFPRSGDALTVGQGEFARGEITSTKAGPGVSLSGLTQSLVEVAEGSQNGRSGRSQREWMVSPLQEVRAGRKGT